MGFSKYHFKDIGQDEQIIMVIHRNWFYLLEQFFLIFAVAGIFFAGVIGIPMFFPDILNSANAPVMLFAENFLMLAVWVYGFMIWIDYYFDIWIITSHRIINIEQEGLFSRKVSEMTYEKIQDITTKVDGFIPTLVNYGDLVVQTAGDIEDFIFRTISDPYHVKNVIAELQQKNEKNSTDMLGEMIKEKVEGQ